MANIFMRSGLINPADTNGFTIGDIRDEDDCGLAGVIEGKDTTVSVKSDAAAVQVKEADIGDEIDVTEAGE